MSTWRPNPFERAARRQVRDWLKATMATEETKGASLSAFVAASWARLVTTFPDEHAAITDGADLGDPATWRREMDADRLEALAVRIAELILRLRAKRDGRPEPSTYVVH
jgi:hypothetical protein